MKDDISFNLIHWNVTVMLILCVLRLRWWKLSTRAVPTTDPAQVNMHIAKKRPESKSCLVSSFSTTKNKKIPRKGTASEVGGDISAIWFWKTQIESMIVISEKDSMLFLNQRLVKQALSAEWDVFSFHIFRFFSLVCFHWCRLDNATLKP